MKLLILFESKEHKRAEQIVIKRLGSKCVKALKKINKSSNIKPSARRGAFGFGGGTKSRNRCPDFMSFLQGVKPVWHTSNHSSQEFKKDKRIVDLKKNGDIDWIESPAGRGTVFYWTEFQELVINLVDTQDKLISARYELKESEMFTSKRYLLQISIDYINGMLFGYNEDEVLGFIGRYVKYIK